MFISVSVKVGGGPSFEEQSSSESSVGTLGESMHLGESMACGSGPVVRVPSGVVCWSGVIQCPPNVAERARGWLSQHRRRGSRKCRLKAPEWCVKQWWSEYSQEISIPLSEPA